MIYEHVLKFRRGIDATRAKPVVSGLIDVTRIRVGEFDYPVVIFQTDYPLLDETCTRLQRLANMSAKFNIPLDTVSGRIEDAPLTAEQERLYARLVSYCAEHYMWCGNASKLALFADLSYPFDPNIVYDLVERRLIKHNALDSYALTIEK